MSWWVRVRAVRRALGRASSRVCFTQSNERGALTGPWRLVEPCQQAMPALGVGTPADARPMKRPRIGGAEGQVPGQQYFAIPWNTSQAISMGTKIMVFPPIVMVRNLTVLPLWV